MGTEEMAFVNKKFRVGKAAGSQFGTPKQRDLALKVAAMLAKRACNNYFDNKLSISISSINKGDEPYIHISVHGLGKVNYSEEFSLSTLVMHKKANMLYPTALYSLIEDINANGYEPDVIVMELNCGSLDGYMFN